ncbi:uncharacterized protein KNN_06955 (plasmid) [Bacillus thuringiensis serovar tolworthi]|uniref:MBL fold metallo-hydrolase n=1 Tax=Bacillus thuringiensis subsp. tolworthi TaxID=1442 RepID=A0A9W4EY14_BACTO|nr:uncharacterized protein KNN_06955 [Bacillus thuringiensis serovar tolworthi]
MFTGDTVGIYYRELTEFGVELYLPSTSPTQFQPDVMLKSKERIKSLNVDCIYFGHYGASTNVSEVYRQLEFGVPLFFKTGKEIFETEADSVTAKNKLANSLFEIVQSHLTQQGIPTTYSIYEDILKLEMDVNAKGIIHYLTQLKLGLA